MSLKDNVKNSLLSGGVLSSFPRNQPAEYRDREHRYFERQTTRYVTEMAKYSSDYFSARAQGLYPDAPEEWTDVKIRLADVIKPSAATTRKFDDFKNLLIAEPPIDYVRPGTKFECMGNTWICVNAANISSPIGNGIVRRCNAVWNYLDFYGNVHSEPIIADKLLANANDSDDQQSMLITKGYFNVIAQYNDATRQLDTNSRMILGTGAYRVTGYSDFQTEFTGDYSSVRLLEFTIRYEEPNDVIDDLERHVAGGKSFDWEISAAAKTVLRPGETAQIIAESRRNGEPVQSTEEHPVSYLYYTSAAEIADVDEHGHITGVSEGQANIIVALAQNPACSAEFTVTVQSSETEDHIEFLGTVPEKIGAYRSAELTAAVFAGGEETDEPVQWELSGAERAAYSFEENGNSLLIRCWGSSRHPLTVTAKHNNIRTSAEIALEGV